MLVALLLLLVLTLRTTVVSCRIQPSASGAAPPQNSLWRPGSAARQGQPTVRPSPARGQTRYRNSPPHTN